MILLFYIPVPTKACGLEIAHSVIKESLAACGNVVDHMTSVYEWKGEVCEEEEAVLILKTTPELETALRKRVLDLHPYECPCVLHWTADSNPAFSQWVGDNTA